MMIKTIVFIATMVFAGIGMMFVDRSEKRRAERHMEGREPLMPAEFARKYFSGNEVEVAEKLFPVLARHLPIDLSRLHPEDKLVEELRMDALDSLSAVELVVDVEEEFGLKIPDKEAEGIATFGDLVRYIAEKAGSPTAA